MDEMKFHIHVKNLETKGFFKAIIDYQPYNTTTKPSLLNELKTIATRMLTTMSIKGQEVIVSDISDIGKFHAFYNDP